MQLKVGRYEPMRANFAQAQLSRKARHVLDWAVGSGDNSGMPFVILDKADARVFVFDASGRLRGASSALLGLARGDDSVPGIGQRKIVKHSPRGAHHACRPLRGCAGPQSSGERDSLGGLQNGGIAAPGGHQQRSGAPVRTSGHTVSAGQPNCLRVNRCPGRFLRQRGESCFYRNGWYRLCAARNPLGPCSLRLV